MRFFLNFLSDNYGRKLIDEPIGFADVDFNIKQRSGGMARDVALNGDKIDFEFTYMRNHEIKQLLYYFNRFGFEAKCNLEIEIDANNTYICELDFATTQTDDYQSIKLKGLPLSDYQILKRRKSVKVDLFSDKNADGDYIPPLGPENILMLATPLVQKSKWEQTADYNENLDAKGSDNPTGDDCTNWYFVNPCQSLVEQGVEESSTFFEATVKTENRNNPPNTSDFYIIKAKDNLKNIKINIKGLDLKLTTDTDNGGNGYVSMSLLVKYGVDLATATEINLLNAYVEENRSFSHVGDFTANIPEIKRDDSVWVFFQFKVRQSKTNVVGDPRFECFTEIKSGLTIEATSESTSYNSICPSFGLYDVCSQIVKSISGMEIVAPRFQAGGDLYGNRLLNGNLLRSIKDKPFNISLEDLEKSFPEIKFDYQIMPNGKVFFGGETDFYTNVEMAVFSNTQFDEMSKEFNPLYMVNEFSFAYKNYQSLKENTVAGSADTIHGESRYVFNNKKVENKKVVEVNWTRDTLLIETQRKQALLISENTTTQDDDGIFALDTIATTSDQTFTEVTELSHTYQAAAEKLILRTDGVINFTLLGFQANSVFKIFAPDNNAGDYTVNQIDPSQITLTRISSGAIGSSNDGVRSTRYQYTIDDTYIPYTNRTIQGFDGAPFNLNAGDKYSNLNYSIGWNIRRFWNSYLATCNIFWKDITIKNTWYKNNGECTTSINGVFVKEKDDLLPNNPIVTPFMYSDVVFKHVDFLDFVNLQNAIRTQCGFVRFIDNNRKVVKIYPTDVEYSLLEKKLSIKGEEKYEPTTMLIVTEQNYILINNETRVDSIIYEIKNEKLYVFDSTRQLLYNGVYWHEVSVNGAFANTQNKLKEWMDLFF
jgi:hypothetical protein